MDGVLYIVLRYNELLIVINSQHEIVPSYGLELLRNLISVLEDFIGPLSEKIVRTNLVLIYDILDEYFDFGYAGITSSDELSKHIDYKKTDSGVIGEIILQAKKLNKVSISQQ